MSSTLVYMYTASYTAERNSLSSILSRAEPMEPGKGCSDIFPTFLSNHLASFAAPICGLDNGPLREN